MRQEREKPYWVKKIERCPNVETACLRAGKIRIHGHTSQVQVRQLSDGFQVCYSVARWYLEQLNRDGLRL